MRGSNLTASSETLIWKPLNVTNGKGIDSAWEAFILVPVDYEDDSSPLIPINIKKFQKSSKNSSGSQTNIWFIPGGPGQSSQILNVYMDLILKYSPAEAVIYAIDHRGLGKSTPLANSREGEMLKENERNPKVLSAVLERKQKQLGLLMPLTRVLRVENVARDLLKGLSMVKSQDQPKKSKNYLLSVSYGTLLARRAIQIQPEAFEAVIFDGLAALERIEISNEADRALEEFCNQLPNCRQQLELLPKKSQLRIRSLIPKIISIPNQCTRYMTEFFGMNNVCQSLHLLLNGALLQGITLLKVVTMRILFEMTACNDIQAFTRLVKSLDRGLRSKLGGNALQSITVINASDKGKNDSKEEAASINEFVFEVISALERYHTTKASVEICFNQKHSVQGDSQALCPSRLFDPCRFFKMAYERTLSLKDSIGEIPEISIQSPDVQSKSTRFLVLAGLLDFSTPTVLAREIYNQFLKSPEKHYHEFQGLSHGVFGSSGCEKEIFADFLTGGNRTVSCVQEVNKKHSALINKQYFGVPLDNLTNQIEQLV